MISRNTRQEQRGHLISRNRRDHKDNKDKKVRPRRESVNGRGETRRVTRTIRQSRHNNTLKVGRGGSLGGHE